MYKITLFYFFRGGGGGGGQKREFQKSPKALGGPVGSRLAAIDSLCSQENVIIRHKYVFMEFRLKILQYKQPINFPGGQA